MPFYMRCDRIAAIVFLYTLANRGIGLKIHAFR